ncbi:MAG: transposase, partial [Rickettsia endosymbiont of Platyusa sonomae]|nr:transposase [Rickettsia endosymbiont of Platyusa sonomae]
GMMEYVMKHIHQRDMIKLWEQFLERFKLEILVDKENGYIYLRSFLWYTDAKLSEERQSELEQLLAKYLSEEEKGNIMRTVAQKYIEEGEAIGEARGEIRGEEKKAMAAAKNLLKVGVSIDIISTSTGLSKKVIEELMV